MTEQQLVNAKAQWAESELLKEQMFTQMQDIQVKLQKYEEVVDDNNSELSQSFVMIKQQHNDKLSSENLMNFN